MGRNSRPRRAGTVSVAWQEVYGRFTLYCSAVIKLTKLIGLLGLSLSLVRHQCENPRLVCTLLGIRHGWQIVQRAMRPEMVVGGSLLTNFVLRIGKAQEPWHVPKHCLAHHALPSMAWPTSATQSAEVLSAQCRRESISWLKKKHCLCQRYGKPANSCYGAMVMLACIEH